MSQVDSRGIFHFEQSSRQKGLGFFRDVCRLHWRWAEYPLVYDTLFASDCHELSSSGDWSLGRFYAFRRGVSNMRSAELVGLRIMRWPDRRTNVGKWREPEAREYAIRVGKLGFSGLVGPKRPRLRLTLSGIGSVSNRSTEFILTFRHFARNLPRNQEFLAFFYEV